MSNEERVSPLMLLANLANGRVMIIGGCIPT